MNAFLLGLIAGFLGLLVVIFVLRMTVPYSGRLFAPNPIPYRSKKESTDWLNFTIYRILTHFESERVLTELSHIISSKIHPHSFRLISLGNAPRIPSISTIDTGCPDDIRIIIPIDWNGGPSIDLAIGSRPRLRVEVDLIRIQGQLLFSWPGGIEHTLQVRLDHDFTLELEIGLQIGQMFQISITRLPLLGPVLTGIVVFVVTRHVFAIDFPATALADGQIPN
jgi:hypothetical protein